MPGTKSAAEPKAAVIPATDSPSVGLALRLQLFRLVLLHRLMEDRVLILYRQGRIPGSVYTGRGQEAVGAAAGLALGPDDVVAPLNRELGCHLARGVSVAHVFRNYFGRATGPTQGRDGNMHFGVPELGIFPLVSMLGNLVPVTVGAALTFKRRAEPRVALTFFGDGAMSTGDVHEGLNLAAVWSVPAVFVVQSNQIAYSTPTTRQMVNTNIAERLMGGWSIAARQVDGTDAIAVYEGVKDAVEQARTGHGPQAVETLSLRMAGHGAHDNAGYMDAALKLEYERTRDPIERLEARLRLDGVTEQEVTEIREGAVAEVAEGLEEAESAPAPDPETLADGVYANPLGGG